MQGFNQRREVPDDVDVLRQLINQAQIQNQSQMLVPRQEVMPNEYRVPSENDLRNADLAGYIDNDARELDLNRRRNEILDETWG